MASSFICKVSLPNKTTGTLNRSRSHSRSISPYNTTESNPNLTNRHIHNLTATVAGTDCEKYCIFTCQEQSSVVITSQKPIQAKLIDSLLTRESDIEYVCKTALNSAELYEFDCTYSIKDSTFKMYTDYVKPYVHNLLAGQKGLVILFGPSDCGKSTILREKSDDKGILIKMVEDVFKLLDLSKQSKPDASYNVIISAFSILDERVVDLLDVTNKAVELSKDEDGNWYANKGKEKILKNVNELFSLLQHVTKIRKMEERIEGEECFNKTHIVFQILVGKYAKGQLVQEGVLQIAEICGSEQASGTSKYQKSVARSFNYLSEAIYNSGVGKIYPYISKASLTKVLSPTLYPNSPILLISCVSPLPSSFIHCLPALKYATSIKDCIAKDLISSANIPDNNEGSQLEILEKELVSNGYQHAEYKVFENWYNTKKQELHNCLKKYKELYNDSSTPKRDDLSTKIDSTNKLLDMLEEYKNNHQINYVPVSSKPLSTTERKVEDLEKKLHKLETSIHQIEQISTEKNKEIVKEKANASITSEFKPTNSYKRDENSLNHTVKYQLPNNDKLLDQIKDLQKEMLLLQEELTNKNQLIQKYEITINDQRQSYEMHFTEMKNQISQSSFNSSEQEKANQRLIEELKVNNYEQKVQIESLKTEYHVQSQDKEELESKITLLNKQKCEMENSMMLYMKKQEELEKVKSISADAIVKITKENKELKDQLSNSQNDTVEAMHKLESLKKLKKEVDDNLIQEKAKKEDLKIENEELRRNLNKARQDHDNNKKETTNSIKSLEQKIQAFSQLKDKLSDDIIEANSKQSQLTIENEEFSSSLKKALSEVDILKKECHQFANEKQSIEQRLIGAEAKCETLSREKMQGEAILMQLKNQLSDSEIKVQDYERTKTILETTKQEEIDAQTQKILDLEIKVAGDHEEIEMLKQSNTQLENEIKEYKLEIDKLNDQIKECEQINESIEQKYSINIEALNTEIQSNIADNSKLKEACETFKLSKEKTEQLSQGLKEECEEMAQVNKTLKKQIKELEKALNGYAEQKEQELKNNQRKESEKEKGEIKTKMINEIHGMIQQFREERTKKHK